MHTISRSPLLPALCALACSGMAVSGAHAVDSWDHGLWLGFQSLPTEFESEVSGDFSGSNEDDLDSAGRLALGWRGRAPGQTAFVVSAGLAFTVEEYEDTDVTGTGLVVEPGVSWHFNGGFELDLVGVFGAGVSTLDSGSFEEDGTYGEFGVMIRPAYQHPEGFRIYADLGYMSRSQEWEIEESGISFDQTLDTSGFAGGLGIGFMF
ncbi:MAG: hypothetical protein ACOCXA_04180 [Planctomycetota bacterium]